MPNCESKTEVKPGSTTGPEAQADAKNLNLLTWWLVSLLTQSFDTRKNDPRSSKVFRNTVASTTASAHANPSTASMNARREAGEEGSSFLTVSNTFKAS